jgi:hypothetical protein
MHLVVEDEEWYVFYEDSQIRKMHLQNESHCWSQP